MLCPHEQLYVRGSCDEIGPVSSPTVAICGCVLTRKENRVDPENGDDVRYTKGNLADEAVIIGMPA